MRTILSAFFLLLSATLSHAACTGPNSLLALPEETQAELRARTAKVPFPQGILWHVEKDGITSVIAGTMHLAHPTHAKTLAALDQLDFQPEQLLLELTTQAQTDFQRHLLENPDVYLIEQGDSLIDRLGEDHWAAISKHLQERGIPPFLAARYQPWFLGMTLAIPPCAMADIAAGKRGLDHMIEQRADSSDLPKASLDTAESLLDILAADPIEVQVQELRWTLELDLMESNDSQMPTMMALYGSEDIQLIWELGQYETVARAQDDAAARDITMLLAKVEAELIAKRNRLWADQLIPALETKPSLVAVGALHLPGEHGLLTLLQDAGYTITRLSRD